MFKKESELNSIVEFSQQARSQGKSQPIHLEFTLTQNQAESVNEIGVFTVDDRRGTIDGITPESSEYPKTALSRARVIFSAISRPAFPHLSRQRRLTFDSRDRLRFYLVANNTTETVLAELSGGGTSSSVFFAGVAVNGKEYGRVEEIASNRLVLVWENRENSDFAFNDVMVKGAIVETPPPPETELQGEKELIDLRTQKGEIAVSFNVMGEAAYRNSFGFYVIDDPSGRIGNLRPGDAGYAEAAVRNRLDLNGGFPGGKLLAPFFIANGTPEEFLAENPGNQSIEAPIAYFVFVAANPEGIDRIRLLGDNTFAFEDLPGGGDRDYNDLIVQLTLSTIPNRPPIVRDIPDRNLNIGKSFELNAGRYFTDADGDELTYRVENKLPPWLQFDGKTGNFRGTPEIGDIGELDIKISASDGRGGEVSETFVLDVRQTGNNAPVIEEFEKTGEEDIAIAFKMGDFTRHFSDSDGERLEELEIASLPDRGTLKFAGNDVTLQQKISLSEIEKLIFFPDDDWSGNTEFQWNGSDGKIYADAPKAVKLTVNPVNDRPENFVPGRQKIATGTEFVFTGNNGIVIRDRDADFLRTTLTATGGILTLGQTNGIAFVGGVNGSSNFSIEGTIGAINDAIAGLRFTPNANFIGTAKIEIQTDDLGNIGKGGALTDIDTVEIRVLPADAMVTVGVAPANVLEDSGTELVYEFTRTDSLNSPLSAPLTVNFTVNGSASFGTGNDYLQTGTNNFTNSSGSIVFAANSSTALLTLTPIADTTNEPDETINLTLNTGTGYAIATTGAVISTINNDDSAPLLTYNFSASNYSTVEGDITNTTNLVTVTRSGSINFASSVDIILTGGSQNPATSGTDFTGGTITLNFAAGETSKIVPIEILGDEIAES
ncbi:MAG: DUF4114 domain-containing protein, partial [Spirulina sp.]